MTIGIILANIYLFKYIRITNNMATFNNEQESTSFTGGFLFFNTKKY